MAVKMLSQAKNAKDASSISGASITKVVKAKYSAYLASSPKDYARKASELAKRIREFEAGVKSDPRPAVKSRNPKGGLFPK